MTEADSSRPNLPEGSKGAPVGTDGQVVKDHTSGSGAGREARPAQEEGNVQTDPLDDSPLLETVLGPALEPLRSFRDKLGREGLERGIIGPRDQGIIWERHILNSAALVPFILDSGREGEGRTIADVGSGGGFPGVVLAACLPDWRITLIEPMERRVEWLREVVDELQLRNVRIVRGRAEDLQPTGGSRQGGRHRVSRRPGRRHQAAFSAGAGPVGSTNGLPAMGHDERPDGGHSGTPSSSRGGGFDDHGRYGIVTCRAVAPMTKLAGWTLPLLVPGGRLIALKGRSAEAEITKAAKEIRKYHGVDARVCEAEVGEGLEATHVVLIDKGR